MGSTTVVLIIVVVVLLVAALGFGAMLLKRKQSENLRKHFGTEYERTVAETGDRKAGESELRERQQRRRELDIRDLRPEERSKYQESWNSVQRDFVDDPARAMDRADELVVAIMRTRGYPVDDFNRRADDISVDHPNVVRHYREARSVRDASSDGSVDTERQRGALTSYRSLVEELLGRDRTAQADGRGTGTGETDHREHRADTDDRDRGADNTERARERR
ncbi:hypothetical protein ACTXG6_28855 [Pseudonocardia sp. Cha107L01]|jgi:hypothetical protein|uniref:hypothetical protein n=1 Tax=Pseudonocardia sp. Cha107L01 TaxID=3457576 RepID=UPI00403E7436